VFLEDALVIGFKPAVVLILTYSIAAHLIFTGLLVAFQAPLPDLGLRKNFPQGNHKGDNRTRYQNPAQYAGERQPRRRPDGSVMRLRLTLAASIVFLAWL
jgi:hypothetical protein